MQQMVQQSVNHVIWGASLCAVVMIVETVMQKTLWCDRIYIGKKISTPEIHCQLMLVFGDGVLRPHHLCRGCTEFRSGLAAIMKIIPFSLAYQEHANTVQVVELVLENQQDIV